MDRVLDRVDCILDRLSDQLTTVRQDITVCSRCRSPGGSTAVVCAAAAVNQVAGWAGLQVCGEPLGCLPTRVHSDPTSSISLLRALLPPDPGRARGARAGYTHWSRHADPDGRPRHDGGPTSADGGPPSCRGRPAVVPRSASWALGAAQVSDPDKYRPGNSFLVHQSWRCQGVGHMPAHSDPDGLPSSPANNHFLSSHLHFISCGGVPSAAFIWRICTVETVYGPAKRGAIQVWSFTETHWLIDHEACDRFHCLKIEVTD